MLSVKRASGFNYSGRGTIWGSRPFVGVNRLTGYRFKCRIDEFSKLGRLDRYWIAYFVVIQSNVCFGFLCRFGDKQYRNDRFRMTGFVEVLQVQCIIPYLFEGCSLKCDFSDFEFNNKYDGANDQNCI